MLKKHMAACLVATAFAAAPALAQTPPPPSGGTDRPVSTGSGSPTAGSPAMQPGAGSSTATPGSPAAGSMPMQPSTTAGSTASGTPSAGSPPMPPGAGSTSPAAGATTASAPPPGGSPGQFMTQIQSGQVMASKLIGTTVVGANNESIGDVNDVIVDRKGQAVAVVIGVGGFLGIGEKDVAVSFQQLEFASAQQAAGGGGAGTTTSASSATNSTVATTGSTGSAQQDSATNRSTATTGNTGNPGPGSGATGADPSTPDRIMLRMTKAELQAAPTFSSSGRAQNAGGTGAAAPPKP